MLSKLGVFVYVFLLTFYMNKSTFKNLLVFKKNISMSRNYFPLETLIFLVLKHF